MSFSPPSPANRAPLLLQTPPFHASVPSLGQVQCSWGDLTPSHDAPADHDAVRALLATRTGGTFWAPLPPLDARRAIVVCASGDPARATALWTAARNAHEVERLVLLLPEPDIRFQALMQCVRADGGAVVAGSVNPWALLDNAADIICDADEIGTLAALGALRDLPVWRNAAGSLDLIRDSTATGRAVTLLDHATRYRCPFHSTPITAQDAISLLDEWQQIIMRNRSTAVCVGMSLWKRRRIADLFATADPRRPFPVFRRGAAGAVSAARGRGGIAVWSTRMPPGLDRRAEAAAVPVARVEDGFIRSAGLGSGLLPPASIIVDTRGVYYDPARPSDLEHLLATHPLGPDLQVRAEKLIACIVAGGVSKYAHGGATPDLGAPPGRRVVLVPGQVADDLSVRLGGAGIAGNLELLRRVRTTCPDAFIVYRPHPDVDAGHRLGAIPDEQVLTLADHICRMGAMAPLLDIVDEVHTLTSLAGFEALMRGKAVTTYGQPFYAGWGLTQDHAPLARRTRRLTIAQLAAATLLLYPRYIDPLTRLPCGPEVLISRFGMPSLWRPTLLMRLRRHQGAFRKAANKGAQSVFRTIAAIWRRP